MLRLQAGYGNEERRNLAVSFRLGEGLVGQCAKEQKRILLTEVPGDYVRINSGLGASPPLNIIVLPVLFEGSVRAVIELASFSRFSPAHQAFLEQITESIGLVLNTIETNTMTENLLKQSQSQAEELRAQQEELRGSNEGLALSSTYKSEFIANMSHELRTPLNSLLILAEQLEANPDDNMTDIQVKYASVIRSSGNDLLSLLNNILDLAKAESGTVTVELSDLSIGQLRTALLRDFGHVAEGKGVDYSVDVAPGAPEGILTDPQRLRQILTNLLANAFKFTEQGHVHLAIGLSDGGWNPGIDSLARASAVVALAVTDTGIGIELDQQKRIFEPFAQGDGTTARLYGGTGLGLSISRELVGLLGGELVVVSEPGRGSTFTVYLPAGGPEAAATADRASRPRASSSPASALAPLPPRPAAVVADQRPMNQSERDFQGTKVLVVDDDFRNIFAMTALLERGRAEVTTAESGIEAIAILERVPDIDIVLMDIMMPVMDGYATIQAIRSNERFKSLPIVAVTGKVMPGERQRCLDAGANDFVPKPVDTAELIAVLTPWLRAVGTLP